MAGERQSLISKRESAILQKNWDNDHTRPAVPHYDHEWLHDSVYAVDIYNSLGKPDRAATELTSLFKGQDKKTGFIPNMIYLTGHNWRDIEALTFPRPDIGSGYTQPPIIAWGAWGVYETNKQQGNEATGRQFLEDSFDRMAHFYSYFEKYRENGNRSKLIGNVHPHETGMDSNPALRPNVPFIPGKGKAVGLINGAIDYGTILKLNVQQGMRNRYPEKGRPTMRDIIDFKARKERKKNKTERRQDWNPEFARKNYWTNDVSFNCLYVESIRYMSQISETLGKKAEAQKYTKLAKEVEHEILTKMWNEEDGMFYNLDKDGKQIRIASVSSLHAVMLDNISEHQLSGMTRAMEDPQKFNTPYPFPSVPVDSKYYNPYYTEPRLWKRGEVWINANKKILDGGLAKQIERDDLSQELKTRMISVLKKGATKTEELVVKDLLTTGTSHEFYGAENGKGYRIEGFTWSLGGLHLDKSKALLDRSGFPPARE